MAVAEGQTMPRYFEFEVALQDTQPRIWRSFLLRRAATFADLHQAIQDSFGWQGRHLWEFRLPTDQGRPIAGLPGGEEYDRPAPEATRLKLTDYFTGERVVEWCEYLYDFGEDWVHEVRLIGVYPESETFQRRLLDGERAGPPEDCGGTSGYLELVHFLETGEGFPGQEAVEVRAWLGSWRPDAFDAGLAAAAFDR